MIFTIEKAELYCEDVPLSRIAKEVGTPCYIYSHHTLVRHFRSMTEPSRISRTLSRLP